MEQRNNWMSKFSFNRWPVFYKIFGGVLIVLALASGITMFVSIRVSRSELKEGVRSEFVALSTAVMEQVLDVLHEQITILRSVAISDDFTGEASSANAKYGGGAEELRLNIMENQWDAGSLESELVKSVTDPGRNSLTRRLRNVLIGFPNHVEMRVTDRYGALLAATDPPIRYVQDEEVWWRTAYNGGQGAIYIGQPELRPGDLETTIEIALPLISKARDEVIGVVYTRFRITPIQQVLNRMSQDVSIGAVLVNPKGRVLASRYPDLVSGFINLTWLNMNFQTRTTHWQESLDVDGVPLLIGHTRIEELRASYDEEEATAFSSLLWTLFAYQPRYAAYAPVRRATLAGALTSAFLTLLSAGGTVVLARVVSTPLRQFVSAVRQIAAGASHVRAWVYADDEIAEIATAYNTLLDKNQEQAQTLESIEVERERARSQRERDLEAAAAVGESASSASDIETLSQQVVDLIHDRFGLYYAGLFLVDDLHQWAVLRAGTGEAGATMLARGHRIKIGEGMTGWSIAHGQRRVSRDVSEDQVHLATPELPYTRAEAILPLRSRGEVLGALALHSYHADAFEGDTLIVLQTIADQVAVAIDSLNMFEERQAAMRSLQRAYGEMSRDAWQDLLASTLQLGQGYEANIAKVTALEPAPPDTWSPEARRAWDEEALVHASGAASPVGPRTSRPQSATSPVGPRTSRPQSDAALPSDTLALPIKSRGEVVGVIDVAKQAGAGAWTSEEVTQLSQLVDALGLALENARLYEETQSRETQERLVGEITSQFRGSLDLDSIMRAAAQEIGVRLGLHDVTIQLESPTQETEIAAKPSGNAKGM